MTTEQVDDLDLKDVLEALKLVLRRFLYLSLLLLSEVHIRGLTVEAEFILLGLFLFLNFYVILVLHLLLVVCKVYSLGSHELRQLVHICIQLLNISNVLENRCMI